MFLIVLFAAAIALVACIAMVPGKAVISLIIAAVVALVLSFLGPFAFIAATIAFFAFYLKN